MEHISWMPTRLAGAAAACAPASSLTLWWQCARHPSLMGRLSPWATATLPRSAC